MNTTCVNKLSVVLNFVYVTLSKFLFAIKFANIIRHDTMQILKM